MSRSSTPFSLPRKPNFLQHVSATTTNKRKRRSFNAQILWMRNPNTEQQWREEVKRSSTFSSPACD